MGSSLTVLMVATTEVLYGSDSFGSAKAFFLVFNNFRKDSRTEAGAIHIGEVDISAFV